MESADAALVQGALEAVVDLDDLTAGRALGVSHATLREWRRGKRPKLRFHTRRLLEGFLAKAPALVGGRAPTLPTPRELDPVAVAVGEFRAIQRIAGDLAKFAGEAGARLAGATAHAEPSVRAPTFPAVEAASPSVAGSRSGKAVQGRHG